MSLRSLRERFLPRGPLDLVIQLAVVAAAYTAWRYARGAVAPDDLGAAFAHGRDLVSLERSMHGFVEVDVQRWAVDSSWAGEVARWGYANLHFKGGCLALALIYFGSRDNFGFVRNTVIAAMALSVLVYWLYPTAPPRFLDELGLDPSSAVTGNDPLLSNPGDPLFNPVAAVPSMHVGLAIIFSWSLAFLVRPIWLKAPLFAYPLLMTYVVVASGNHYWIDALFGALVAAAAAGIAYALGRIHPDWAFHRRASGATDEDVRGAIRTAPA
ncbi:MAG TPA: phosphatase PAP2 family protein [Solirubrobacterales bacterium]|nr:phosphatase PAP2 family protein [Solirubrobacterales bacterium]